MRDRVAFADIGEELVPKPLTLRRSRHQSRDVDELDRRRDDFLRRGDRSPGAQDALTPNPARRNRFELPIEAEGSSPALMSAGNFRPASGAAAPPHAGGGQVL